MDLSSSIALVSGGASGIGLAIAKQLIQHDVAVAIADVNQCAELPAKVQQYTCDVASREDVAQLYEDLTERLGAPAILVCCAGIDMHERLAEGDPEKWQRVINVNVMGTLRLIRAFLPNMLAQQEGHIVIVSSVAAHKPYTYGGIYAASKAALDIIAETLRLEVLPTIRVTVVAPGWTNSAFLEHRGATTLSLEEVIDALAPDDVARAVLYAMNQPAGVAINNITVRPTSQEF